MKTMTKATSLIGCAGGRELSTCKLKELGRNAEKEAMECYEEEVATQNAINHELPPNVNVNVGINALDSEPKSPVDVPQDPNEFWQSIFPDECHILSMEPDGNCFFCSILDQLYHDNRARHNFTCHQITNHISRNGDAFKKILLLQDNHETFPALTVTSIKWGRTVHGGGLPEVYAAAWFYGMDITIYAQEYANTGGFLMFKGDEPRTIVAMLLMQYGPYLITVTTITKAFIHPGTPLVPLNTS